MRMQLRRVQFMPKELEPGVLYVSEEFGAAAHLCACSCGSKVRTPLGPTDWTLEETPAGPSLWPSVGNWQKPCRSHYWIREGTVVWAEDWTDAEVRAGRRAEMERAHEHYGAPRLRRVGRVRQVWKWVERLFTGGRDR